MSQKTKIIFGFATIYLVWGSTYLAIRFGVETMPPFLMAGVRFIIGGFLLYGWAIIRGAEKPDREHYKPALIMGLLMPLGGVGLVTYAETMISSGLAALLVTMVPMWIVLIEWVRPSGSRPSIMVVIGLLLGFGGVAMLILPSGFGELGDFNRLGAMIIVLSSLSWALGTIYSKHAKQPKSKILSTGLQMIAGGVALMFVSTIVGEFNGLDISLISVSSWLALAYLTVLGSFTFAAYIWLISSTDPSKVATYAYVNPIIAILLGTFLAGELLTGWIVFCSTIVLLAVFLIISAKGRKQAEQPDKIVKVTHLLTEEYCQVS